MSDKRNETLFNKLIRFYTPTKEQLARPFTEEETKLICLHKKCHVQMHLFNPVHDSIEKYKKAGKAQKWPPEKLNRKVIEAVTRRMRKHGDIYPRHKIEKFVYEEWAQRKNFNIRWLEYYQHRQLEDGERKACENHADVSNASDTHEHEVTVGEILPQEDQPWTLFEVNNNNIITGALEPNLLEDFMQCQTESLEIRSQDIRSQMPNACSDLEKEPQSEQAEYHFTDEEIKLICLNRKSYVQMSLFNPVNDCIQEYKKNAGLYSYSLEELKDKVVKGVTHRFGKPRHPYSRRIISSYRHKERERQRKINIRWLENYRQNAKLKSYQVESENEADISSSYTNHISRTFIDTESVFQREQTLPQNIQAEPPGGGNACDKTKDFNLSILEEFMQCNTESMEVNTASVLATSQSVHSMTDSIDFNHFVETMPSTSTQSPSH